MVYLYKYIPNSLTLLRMISAPFLWVAINTHAFIYSMFLITFAIVSDFGDGYTARRFLVSSRMGSFLDPLADKLVILVAFIALWQQQRVSLWVVLVIALRDLGVTWLRTFFLRRGIVLRTSWFAKSKTAVQFVALYLFVIGMAYQQSFGVSGSLAQVFFYRLGVGVAVITVASSLSYWYRLYSFVRFGVVRGKP